MTKQNRNRRLRNALATVGALGLCVVPAAHAGIALNTIDTHATYSQGGAELRASGPIGCTRGERIAVRVSARQAATGARAGAAWTARCTGEVQHWQVRARARTEDRFAEGKATICAVAETRTAERVTGSRRWCRRVTVSAPF